MIRAAIYGDVTCITVATVTPDALLLDRSSGPAILLAAHRPSQPLPLPSGGMPADKCGAAGGPE